MHSLFPGNQTDPDWHTMHGYTYHAYNKGGIKMLNDATLLRDAMRVRCRQHPRLWTNACAASSGRWRAVSGAEA